MSATFWSGFSPLLCGVIRCVSRLLSSVGSHRLTAALLVSYGLVASAQSAHFAGVQTALVNGYGYSSGIAVDSSHNLYVTDLKNNAVRELLAVNGSIPASPTVVTLATGLAAPQGIVVDGHGNVYFADGGNNAVKEILAINGVIPSSPTIVTLTTIEFPTGLALDASGDLFFTGGCVPGQTGQCGSILELPAVNGVIPPFTPEVPIHTYGSRSNMAFDVSGNLYFVDDYTDSLTEMLAVNGSVTSSSPVRTIATFPSTTKIVGIVLDSSGNLYATDILYNVVDKMFAVGGGLPANPITETLGSGFSEPAGLAIDGDGILYIEDALNNRTVSLLTTVPNFGSVPVRSSATAVPLTFTFDTAGTLGSLAVLTGGAPALDFTNTNSGTCAPGTATAQDNPAQSVSTSRLSSQAFAMARPSSAAVPEM